MILCSGHRHLPGMPGWQDRSVVFTLAFASGVAYFGGLATDLTCFWTSVHMVTIFLSAALLD